MRSGYRHIGRTFAAALLIGTGFILGQQGVDPLSAQQSKQVVQASANTSADKRVIAYIYGNTPITREEFGDYLISQFGADRVRLFVNRRVIELAAAKRGIVISPQEIDAIIDQDCSKLGFNRDQFITTVLKQKYGKTIDEWRNDVIKPRLIMQQICRDSIKFEEEDLKKMFENIYGEKVQCKIILWKPEDKNMAFRMYGKIRDKSEEFDDAARNQYNADLAARGGLVDPIGRHNGPATAKIEEIAFRLKEGQLSEIIDTPGGSMVIKCVKTYPANTEVKFEAVKPLLVKAVTERMMEAEIPKAFARLNDEASPLFVLAPSDFTRKEIEEQSKRILGVDPKIAEPKTTK